MVSLVVAIPFGVASAVIYGASIVVQHRMAQEHSDGDGQASAAGLFRLFRSPTFIIAIGGDLIGFLLQVVALSLGSVVIIQPLVVLMLLPVLIGLGLLVVAAVTAFTVARSRGGLIRLLRAPAP